VGWSRACSELRIRWRVVEQHAGCLELEQSCHICVAVPVAERLWLNMRLFLKPAGDVIQHVYSNTPLSLGHLYSRSSQFKMRRKKLVSAR
jgi:hypothetical protein